MRTEKEVLAKLDEVRRRKLSELLDSRMRRSYLNCEHNARLQVKGHGQVGFCQNPDLLRNRKQGRLLVCNDDVVCGRCASYRCSHTPESVSREFEGIISSPARCGEEYPKLAVLLWVLADTARRDPPRSRFLAVLSRLRRGGGGG